MTARPVAIPSGSIVEGTGYPGQYVVMGERWWPVEQKYQYTCIRIENLTLVGNPIHPWDTSNKFKVVGYYEIKEEDAA